MGLGPVKGPGFPLPFKIYNLRHTVQVGCLWVSPEELVLLCLLVMVDSLELAGFSSHGLPLPVAPRP